ncbi:MAG TPA: metallophosphoesterase [Opitutaceae bacterium]|nr:metallophosphoesterase [Opitutaceae bacterium]
MPISRHIPLLLAAGMISCAAPCRGDPDEVAIKMTPLQEIAAKLPPEVGDAAQKWLTDYPEKDLRAFAAFSPVALEQEVMEDLAEEPGAAQFVLRRMADEPAATDLLVIKKVVRDDFWIDVPGVAAGLQRLAETATDPDLMLAFLDAERKIEIRLIRRTLTERIADARKKGDAAALKTLAAADERWEITERGATIPGYMRRVPPVFSIMPADKPIRIVGMGDFGSGAQAQRDVAAAIVRMGKEEPFNFGVTFGDNFYETGMDSPDDRRWRDWWENLYGPLGITFYPSLGNHEWYADDGAAAEITYRSPTWFFPAPYYTFTAGPVQFYAVDTTEISEAEVLWLDRAIAGSKARWKVVYGHHPIFAPEKKKSGEYMKYMQARLWPLLRGRVDAYLCGHQHAMAHMDARDGVHFFMSGGGGGPLNAVSPKTAGVVFAESTFGFLTLDADQATMAIAIFDSDGKPFDSEVITK